MDTSALAPPAAGAYAPADGAVTAPVAIAASPPAWPVAAVLFAATSVVVGVIWDISWHMTIGRDSFWTPAHMAIYLGGVVAGGACGWLALRTTFAGRPADRAAAVPMWGFRAPLGAWVCIWGAIAMLTSAPLDDWWHNAYGLDVEILSPPHTLLALGIMAIVLGATFMSLAWQNRAASPRDRARFRAAFVYAAGLLVTVFAIMATEYTERVVMRSSVFYRVAALLFPFLLLAAARGSQLRWAATATAGFYSLVTLLMMWILPLFPATPKLGPIYQEVTHMVPMNFPILLVAPAIALDLLMRRWGGAGRDWLLAVAAGIAFVAVLLAAQWPFAGFLLSPASHNWLFAGDNFHYALSKTSYTYRMEFLDRDGSAAAFRNGMLLAVVFGVLSARLGLAWGSWMARVRR